MNITINSESFELQLSLKDVRKIKETLKVDILKANPEQLQDVDFIAEVAALAIRPRGKFTREALEDLLTAEHAGQVFAFLVEYLERMAAPINAHSALRQDGRPLTSTAPAPLPN